jgi:hypothetical protein
VDLEPLEQILTNHFTRAPFMQAQDLYKLLHQATLGSQHAINDEKVARSWLERELVEMGVGPEDPLLDPLPPDGSIVRVHLRPYLQAGKNPETLLQAFIRTANDWRGSSEKLIQVGAAAARLAHTERWSIQPEEIEAFFEEMESQDFPAVHHSEIYQQYYHPAYRVVAMQFLEYE